MSNKNELKKFFVWFRNGSCFVITWFIVLELIARWLVKSETLSVVNLTKTIFWTMGGVLIFCIAFTRIIFKKAGFTGRLAVFMPILTIYEVMFFYSIGIFGKTSHIYQWVILISIVLCLFIVCLMIYGCYRRKSVIYTNALNKYQEERKKAND